MQQRALKTYTGFQSILGSILRCLHNKRPQYLAELLIPADIPRTLRSTTVNDSCVVVKEPRVKRNTFAARAFDVYGPKIWNSLPASLRTVQSLNTFKSKLKTHLFGQF